MRTSWIQVVAESDADEKLLRIYNRISGPDGHIDNILKAHSLRPHSLEGHMALYKAVLHHSGNALSRKLLEAIGVYVSHLNGCQYCVLHHAAGLARLVGDSDEASRQMEALTGGHLDSAFTDRECAALRYAEKLTACPSKVTESDINSLRQEGFDDGEILEMNQVAAYFAYANRTVLGLGVTTNGDKLGLSPGDQTDPNSWRHI